jgi:hypothetical protein
MWDVLRLQPSYSFVAEFARARRFCWVSAAVAYRVVPAVLPFWPYRHAIMQSRLLTGSAARLDTGICPPSPQASSSRDRQALPRCDSIVMFLLRNQ